MWCHPTTASKNLQDTAESTTSGKALLLQKTNEKMITMEVFSDTGEVDDGPLASCRMDGSIHNSALYPLGMEPFPGAKTLNPREQHCQNLTLRGRSFDQIRKPDNSFLPALHSLP